MFDIKFCVHQFSFHAYRIRLIVRSFGTENRQVPKPIPPRNEIYEFIIFRGSDIKDLNVIDVPSQTEAEDSAPQDPAIVSAVSVCVLEPHILLYMFAALLCEGCFLRPY